MTASVAKPQEICIMKEFQEAWPWFTRGVMWSNGLRREGYAPGSKWVVRWQRDAIRDDKRAIVLTVESRMARQQERKKFYQERVQRLKKEANECPAISDKKKVKNLMAAAKTSLSWYRGTPQTATTFLSQAKGSVRATVL